MPDSADGDEPCERSESDAQRKRRARSRLRRVMRRATKLSTVALVAIRLFEVVRDGWHGL